MAFSGSQITRLGLHGGSRSLYGSFAGKSSEAAAIPDVPGIEYKWTGDRLHWIWGGDRLHFKSTADRLHWKATEEK